MTKKAKHPKRSTTEQLTRAEERVKDAQAGLVRAFRRFEEALGRVKRLERRRRRELLEAGAAEPDPYAEAINVPCFTCHVDRGARCVSRGEARETPHASRLSQAREQAATNDQAGVNAFGEPRPLAPESAR